MFFFNLNEGIYNQDFYLGILHFNGCFTKPVFIP